MAILGALAIPLVIWVLEAGAISLVGRIFFGLQATYGDLLPVTVVAWVPAQLGGLIQTILILALPPEALKQIQLSLAAAPTSASSGDKVPAAGKNQPLYNLELYPPGNGNSGCSRGRTTAWPDGGLCCLAGLCSFQRDFRYGGGCLQPRRRLSPKRAGYTTGFSYITFF